MKLRYIISAAIAGLISLSSCVKEEIASLDGLSAEPSYVSAGFYGGTAEEPTSVTAKTLIKSEEDWVLQIPDDAREWLSASVEAGFASSKGVEVVFTMTATQAPRKAEVMLVAGNKQLILTVGQNGPQKMKLTSAKDFNDNDKCPEGPSYYVEGVITKVEKYDYGNLYIRDDAGDQVYVYGVLDADGQSKNFTSLGIDVGDKVILYGPKGSYNGNPQMVNATLYEVTVPAVFDLDFRAIRTAYNEKYANDAAMLEKFSAYTKDDWKNTFKADVQNMQKEAQTITIPLTFKGDELGLGAQTAEWIHLKGMRQVGDVYYMEFDIDAYDQKAAPRKATIVINGKVEMKDKDGKDIVKTSNFELPVCQYGDIPEAITITAFEAAVQDDWVTVNGVVAGVNERGFVITDADGKAIYAKLQTEDEVKIGNEVSITGSKDIYRGFGSLKTFVVRVLSSKKEFTYPEPVECTKDLWDEMTAEGVVSSARYIVVTGAPDLENYGAVTIAEGITAAPYYAPESFEYPDAFAEMEAVTLKGYLVEIKNADDEKAMRFVLVSAEEYVSAPLNESFKSGMGQFTLENKKLTGELTYVWSHDINYGCMKASAYKGGSNEAESWLISPEIDLTAAEADPVLTFEQALKFLNDKPLSDHIAVMAKEVGATDWAALTLPATPAEIGETFGSSFDFYPTTVNCAAYKGKKIQIAFIYKGTTSNTPTWELKNVVLK